MKPNNPKPRAITDDEIAAAAYERYLRRGGQDGPDIDDWLAAEAELRNRIPQRRRGGQELPDSVQDRPEQNAGYDAAVRGEQSLDSEWDMDDGESEPESESVANSGERRLAAIDDRAERDAITEVRRRESKNR